METPFFYLPDISETDTHIQLDEVSTNHCIRVLRKKPGEPVILTNGKGICKKAAIETAHKKHCTVISHSTHVMPIPEPQIAIGISFTKNSSRIEWFLEKATEIGISHIFPLVCKRSEKTHYKFARLRQIMISAMLQSRQYYLPVLHDPVSMPELITTHSFPCRFIAHCEQEEKAMLSNVLTKGKDTLTLIGPEGDFTKEEIAMAKMNSFTAVSLGPHRLRTETAGLVACMLLNAANQ